MTKRASTLWLVFFILSAETAGLVGAFFVGNIDAWYDLLNKPFFSPPNWLFGPVWTLLYLLMGIAAYVVWRELEEGKAAMRVYWVQLLANAVWTPIFFGLHNVALALADILLLLILIIATMIAFARVRGTAAILLIPYVAWVSFAAILNFAIWYLN
ncbi:MAG: tryptophan-rich sensory protein [Patescibacteria group bacterium]|nr:tryptophan-rich sensory protein [Patescibacteria group bacterium]